jgi:UrcA family protein
MRKTLTIALAFALIAPAAAYAAPSPEVRVQVNDLDLDTDAGKAKLESRIRKASREFCPEEKTTGTRIVSTCHYELRKQVLAAVKSRQDRVGKGG